MKTRFAVAALLVAAGVAQAQPTGSYNPAYGLAPVITQTCATGFGNAGPSSGGSELDNAWYNNSGGNLNLLFGGNLEGNGNRIVVFFDTGAAGGFNVLPNGNAGLPGAYSGMKLDTGFKATHFLTYRANDNGVLLAGNLLNGATSLPGLQVALDNSNTGGITNNSVAGAASVFTGFELSLPWATLGVAANSPVRVMAFINGNNDNYLSNQFLGGLDFGRGNLGGDGAGGFNGSVGQIDMTASYAPGDQYFLVPAPGTAALLGLGGLLAARRRRA